MTGYRRYIAPLLLIGGAAAASMLIAERLRNNEKKRQKVKLDDWEGEGGSVAETKSQRLDPGTQG